MSMQRLPGPDGVHWPLILNIPGEGFGDDVLQTWSNHRTLSDSDQDAFLLDQVRRLLGICSLGRPKSLNPLIQWLIVMIQR